MKQVPVKPKGGSRKRDFMMYYKNMAFRKKLLDHNMGMDGYNVGKIPPDIRICSDHAIEPVTL